MKLVCSQAELSAALAFAGRAVSSRPSHPILADFLLKADAEAGQLQISSFDLSLGVITSIAATVEAPGSATACAKIFGDIIGKLPSDGPVSISADKDAGKLKIKSLSGSFSVQCQDPADFPDMPSVDGGTSETFPAETFAAGLKSVLFAASNDESKQLLMGVHLSAGQHGVELAATDGHRLAVFFDQSQEHAPFELTIPGRSVREALRIDGTDIELAFHKGQAVFSAGQQSLITRTLDGTYPNYNQLIPKTFKVEAVFNRKDFISALERVAVLAAQHNNVVKVSVSAETGTAEISCEAQDVGSGLESVACELGEGADLEIAFNAFYLLDGLRVINSEKVGLFANAPTTPAIVRPHSVGEGDVKFSYTYLVMPVQVRT